MDDLFSCICELFICIFGIMGYTLSMVRYRLDVDDAIVIVEQRSDTGYWNWSFKYLDGSHHWNDSNWRPTERAAKAEAKQRYETRQKTWLRRAKWMREHNGRQKLYLP